MHGTESLKCGTESLNGTERPGQMGRDRTSQYQVKTEECDSLSMNFKQTTADLVTFSRDIVDADAIEQVRSLKLVVSTMD